MDPARHGPYGRVPDAGDFPGGAPTAGAPVSPPVPAARGVRAWPVWTLPRWLIGFIAVVVIADGAGIAFTASGR